MANAYKARRDAGIAALAKIPKVKAFRPAGAFYIMVDVRDTGIPSATLAKDLLEEGGVAVLDGNAFGGGGNGYLRLSVATSQELLLSGISRIEAFLQKRLANSR